MTLVFIDLNFDLGINLNHQDSECEIETEDFSKPKKYENHFEKIFHNL